jgi:hypothetical protein
LDFEFLLKKYASDHPKGLDQNFAVFEEGKKYFVGASLPVIGPKYFLRSSGLLVPLQAAIESAPIDSTYRYLPLSELLHVEITLEKIVNIIQQLNRDDFISACAKFRELSHPANKSGELEKLIEKYLPEIHKLASPLLPQNYKYFGPQATLVLMKLALSKGSDNENLPKVSIELFVLLCLAIQDFFAPKDSEDSQKRIRIELPSNYRIHNQYNPKFDLKQFSARWEAKSQDSQELRNQYQSATGFEVEVMASFAAGLAGQESDIRMNFDFHLEEGSELEVQMQKALHRISADIETFAKEMEDPYRDNFIWDFGIFLRYPVIRRSDNRFVVVDPSFLLERGLGWHLVYDAIENYDEHERKRFNGKVSALAEAQTVGLINEHLGSAWDERIVTGTEIKRIFGGHGIKSADVAIEFEDSWLVVEISALRPWYKAFAATSEEDYEILLNQLLDEAKQSVSTCVRLLQHADSPYANFRSVPSGSKMFPIVVLTEKFISNPYILMNVREKLKVAFSDLDSRVKPVEVLNLEEFETLLLMARHFGHSIVGLLSKKYESNYWSDSVNNFLAHHYISELNQLNELENDI